MILLMLPHCFYIHHLRLDGSFRRRHGETHTALLPGSLHPTTNRPKSPEFPLTVAPPPPPPPPPPPISWMFRLPQKPQPPREIPYTRGFIRAATPDNISHIRHDHLGSASSKSFARKPKIKKPPAVSSCCIAIFLPFIGNSLVVPDGCSKHTANFHFQGGSALECYPNFV